MKEYNCKHNWVDKGTYKECSICGEIRFIHPVPMNGIMCDDLDTDSDHFHQSEDEVEQSDFPCQNDRHD